MLEMLELGVYFHLFLKKLKSKRLSPMEREILREFGAEGGPHRAVVITFHRPTIRVRVNRRDYSNENRSPAATEAIAALDKLEVRGFVRRGVTNGETCFELTGTGLDASKKLN
ncbi:MAG: hypothetical protein IH985_00715 [Planctomycetes bacterium]|nr:hypothetical protein [Planctomycetota bacterium]